MLHSVGCSQPNASVFVKNWNRSGLEAVCMGSLTETPALYIRPFLGTTGAGTLAEPPTTPTLGLKCVNRPVSSTRGGATFTCSDTATGKSRGKEEPYEAAVELFASLCKQYNLDPMKDG